MDNVNGYTEGSSNGDEGDVVFLAKISRDIRNMSDGRQLIFGIATGFISGYALTKLGKVMCIVIGTSVIVLQLATQNDYLKFNLVRSLSGDEDNNNITERRRRPTGQIRPNFGWFKNVRTFLLAQPNLTSGYIGGFFVGLGMA